MKIDARKIRTLAKAHGLTNTMLATKAGITRQALQMMLREGRVVEVREKTVKGLVKALRLPDASLLSPDPLLGYKEAVADAHAELAFRGLGLPTAEPRSMDDLYVDVRVVRMPEGSDEHDCPPPDVEAEGTPIEEPDSLPIEEPERLTVPQCLALQRRVLIRGEPGSGKTTALRHAARAYARGLIVEGRYPKQSRLPLMVGLAEFARAYERDSGMTLIRFVVTRTLRDASAEYWAQVEQHIEAELKRGSCLVLLDGLDEVGCHKQLAGVLHRFLEEFSQNQFVLTSRIVGLDAGPWQKLGFATFQTARWGETDIREFARRWYAGRSVAGSKQRNKELDQRAAELTTAILSHPPLLEIASNPLMLTILAGLHYTNATLPRRRIELYAKIVEVMLETWEASKRDARPGDPLHGIVLEAREFGWLLARLALGMQREGRLLRPRWWVNEFVQQFLRDQMALDEEQVKEQAERVVRYLCERTGLLVERGDGAFGFCHRTFQEYCAARGLLLEVEGAGDIVTLLKPYLFHPQWEEVVVHVAAALPAARATALLRIILDDHDAAGRFLRRGQRLALRCLVDGAAVADRALLNQLFSDGELIGASRWLGVSVIFINLLNQLLVTRHAAEAKRTLDELASGARRELPPSDYIMVYSSWNDLPKGPKNSIPGKVCRRLLGGRWVKLIWPAWDRRIENPEAWYEEVLRSVRDPKTELAGRRALISFLGNESDSSSEARAALEKLLTTDPQPAIRAACANALEDALADHVSTANLLLSRLNDDDSNHVRARCAAALNRVAPNRPDVRKHLETLLTCGPEDVRAGAVTGLSRLDFTSPDPQPLLERFLTIIGSPSEPSRVRSACVWAVASVLGSDGMAAVDSAVEQCLDDPHRNVSRAALHVMADAITEGGVEWSQRLIGKLEKMLMAIPDPCPHLFADLVAIVAMKEVRDGRRLDRLLGDALTPLADRITIAFVFGSVARQEQIQDSDVDLMIIGDVRLKEVVALLHTSEEALGRAINPVLFSPEKFRDEFREGNPFLLDVVRKEKIFLKGTRDELTELVADRSPG